MKFYIWPFTGNVSKIWVQTCSQKYPMKTKLYVTVACHITAVTFSAQWKPCLDWNGFTSEILLFFEPALDVLG